MPALSRKMLDDPFKCQEYSTRETWPCQSNIKKTVLPTEFNTYSSRCNTKKGGCWSSYCITVMTPALCMGLGWKHIQSQKLYTLDAGVVKLAACLFFLANHRSCKGFDTSAFNLWGFRAWKSRSVSILIPSYTYLSHNILQFTNRAANTDSLFDFESSIGNPKMMKTFIWSSEYYWEHYPIEFKRTNTISLYWYIIITHSLIM